MNLNSTYKTVILYLVRVTDELWNIWITNIVEPVQTEKSGLLYVCVCVGGWVLNISAIYCSIKSTSFIKRLYKLN
jgi:hypothetical protein